MTGGAGMGRDLPIGEDDLQAFVDRQIKELR